MNKSRLVIALTAAAAFAFVACSDDGDPPKVDKGPKLDGSVVVDMADDAPILSDLPAPPDQGSGECDPACTSVNKWECVKSGNSCVECTMDAHCKNNPWALGPKCDTSNGFCVCAGDTDCASNSWGHSCDTSNQLCGCKTDAECTGTKKCTGDLPFTSSLSACDDPCKSDADCKGAADKCDTATGKCIQCSTDADCGGAVPYCNAKKFCVECKTNTDCATNLHASICDPTSGCVECLKDADCTANSLGNKCDTTSGGCRCSADADCAANNNGKICDTSYKICDCKVDGDCLTGKKCLIELVASTPPNPKVCSTPCTADADCKQKELPFCKTATGLCVQCLKAADCAANQNGSACVSDACTCAADTDCKGTYPWGPKCDTSTYKRCNCTADADCATNPNGPTCYTTYNKCSCKSDADCKTAPYTKCIFPYAGATYKNCQKP